MTWQLLTVISVLTLSVSVLLQRILLHKDKSDPFAYVIVFQGLMGVLVGIYALAVGFEMFDLGALWFPALATVVCYGAGHVAYANTLMRVEASIFSVLFATYVFWVMVFGVTLFSETLGLGQLLGALLIFASIILAAERRGAIRLDRGIWLGLLTGLLFGLATTSWAYVGRDADAASWTALSFIGPALLVLAIQPKAVKHMKPLFARRCSKASRGIGNTFQRVRGYFIEGFSNRKCQLSRTSSCHKHYSYSPACNNLFA